MTAAEYRARIEAVIARTGAAADLPPLAPVVAMAIQSYKPADTPYGTGDNLTSYDITQLLADTCDISCSDVSLVMWFLGFRLVLEPDGGYIWAMQYISPDAAPQDAQ